MSKERLIEYVTERRGYSAHKTDDQGNCYADISDRSGEEPKQSGCVLWMQGVRMHR